MKGKTLDRLAAWKDEVSALLDHGVVGLVAIQKGELSQADFDEQIEKTLGRSDYVRAFPCNKGATTVDELVAFLKARPQRRVHLLGLGCRNKEAQRYIDAAHACGVELVTLDSCLLAESNGKTNGRANHPSEELGGPRVFTAAKEAAAKLVGETGLHLHHIAIMLAWGFELV